MKQPAWTYSQLDSFESCPRKFYHTKVLRDVIEPPTVHSEWGTKVHSAFENFVLTGEVLPEGMEQWQNIATKIAMLPGEKLAEHKFAIDRNFQPADWKASWSRGIADLVVLHNNKAAVFDYKTGKRKPSEQLDLYAVYVFHHFPHIDSVSTNYVWLKERKIDRKTLNRPDTPNVWQAILPRVSKLESAYQRDSWPARTSGLCRGWCPVTSCEFNSNKGK